MRTIIRTQEFDQFYKTLRGNVKTKIEYALNIISEIRVVNTKLAKKLIDTEFYELRISVGNEYRIILFTIDHENLIEPKSVIRHAESVSD